jgi:hypothetical protein
MQPTLSCRGHPLPAVPLAVLSDLWSQNTGPLTIERSQNTGKHNKNKVIFRQTCAQGSQNIKHAEDLGLTWLSSAVGGAEAAAHACVLASLLPQNTG